MAQDEIREFSLAGIFTARENRPAHNETLYLTRLKGWDEFAVEVITVPKLFGAGGYVTETHIPDREIEFTLVGVGVELKTLRRALENKANTLSPVTATRTHTSHTETLTAYITGLTEYTAWSDTTGRITVTLKAINPVKITT